ncbi:MAG TPA: hypothetical protein VJ385_12485 [Fibrobacteria bacterium]|nr:hypothetical protein [Fibrobacteria bacterium]
MGEGTVPGRGAPGAPVAAPRGQRGYVLLLTLVVLGAVMALGLSMMTNVSSGRKIAAESRKGSQSRYAAESAIAMVINRTANSVDSNGYLVEFPSTNVNLYGHNVVVTSDMETNASGAERMDSIRTKFDLLTFRSYSNIEAVSTDTANGSRARIRQRIAFDQYPIFQFATYWEGVMLLDPGSNMTISGRVHCNARVKLFPWSLLSLEDWVTSPCDIWNMRSASGGSIRFKRVDGVLGTYMTAPSSFAPVDTPYYGGTKRMRVAYGSQVPIFKMPIGTRNAILIIQPKGVDDKGASGFSETATSRKQKFVYKADLIYRKRNAAGALLKTWYRNLSDGSDVSESAASNTGLNTSIVNPAGNPNPDLLYDYGDQAWMNASFVDVSKFFLASTAAADQVVYLEGRFNTAAAPVTRDVFVLYNGGTLGRNITFASNCPIYVWGNFNNTATKSAAIVGDIINVLSPGWNPGFGAGTALGSRVAQNNSVYACMLGGVRRARVHPAWNDPADANYYNWNQDDNSSYSDRIGQPHNHMSLMEDWTGKTLTFSGSQVAMWRCLYSTGQFRWNPDNNVYVQPTRNFSFDARYNLLKNMPPGTPTVISPFNLDYYEIHEE